MSIKEMKREYVPADCSECAYQIVSFPEETGSGGLVSVGKLSAHLGWYSSKWSTRLKDAWRAIRYGEPYTDVCFESEQELETVIVALQRAKDYAFPKK